MHAIEVEDGALVWREVETPEPGPGEVRIRVAATAVNRADLMQAKGLYPPPPNASPILGLECSGTIDAVGHGVDRWQVGDEVCALLAGGGYAEQVVCPAVQVLPVPQGVDLHEAAALPEVHATAWLNLVGEAGVEMGDRVLIHAGASGVGTAAIQLCRALGAPCWVTAGSPDKIARCVALGAEAGHDRHAGPWRDAPWAADGFDVILDPVGGGYLADDIRALRTGGRVVVIGLMGGRTAELDLGRLLVKRLRVIGSVLRSRSVREKGEVVSALTRQVWPAVAAGEIRPIVCATHPVTEAAEAHRQVASNDTFGKVLLTVRS